MAERVIITWSVEYGAGPCWFIDKYFSDQELKIHCFATAGSLIEKKICV